MTVSRTLSVVRGMVAIGCAWYGSFLPNNTNLLASHCDRELSRRRKDALDAILTKRQQALARRKKSALHRRVWRRYLREPFWDLKTCLFDHCAGEQNSHSRSTPLQLRNYCTDRLIAKQRTRGERKVSIRVWQKTSAPFLPFDHLLTVFYSVL